MENKNSNIVCTVYVTFNPNIGYLKKSITLIRNQVEKIIIVDNSNNNKLKQEIEMIEDDKIIVLSQSTNIGIAAALNIGCKKAIDMDAKWVLTLDQDSLPTLNMVSNYNKFIEMNLEKKVGAIGPNFTFSEKEKIVPNNTIKKVNTLITSGCFISLEAYVHVGGFREELFIDAVDTEYSWNLRKNGFELYQLNNLILEHNIGSNAYHIKGFGKRFMTITNHNYIRCYYIARNSMQISKEYRNIFPKEASFYKKKAFKKFVMILFFEKDKIKKIKSIINGVGDYKKGKLGVYNG